MLYQILAFTIHAKIWKCHIYKNNKLKILVPTWNEEFELPDGWYSISDIHHHFEYIFKKHVEKTANPSIRIFINKLENRITFLTSETMKLLGSTKNKITKEENGKYLEITEVVSIHCNVVNNSYQQNLSHEFESCIHLFVITRLVNY